MPKGHYNHKGKTNTKAITAINTAYGDEIAGYKKRAAAYRNNRKYTIQETTRATYNILDYIKKCMQSQKPATIAGIILASGFSKRFYYTGKAGELDYLSQEYIEQHNIDLSQCRYDPDGLLIYDDEQLNERLILSPISEIIEKILLIIEDDLQQRSLTDKSMSRTTGAIFNLKAVFNYNDKPEETKSITNNTLIVNANPDQAAKAMQLLLKDK